MPNAWSKAMVKHLERDLGNLQHDITDLARAVEQAVQKAAQSLRSRDTKLAQEVIDGDNPIDQGENLIEEECLKMLAVHQPVAIDLRRIIAAMMINVHLERMADLAEEIAERAIVLTRVPTLPLSDRLERMADLTTVMVRQGLESFVNLDTRLARAVCRLDDEVDRYNREIIAELVEAMRRQPEQVEAGVSLFSATRHLEGIADHATNIAEHVIYLVEGEIVRHHPEAVRLKEEG
jgi:phosphate transport system protein